MMMMMKNGLFYRHTPPRITSFGWSPRTDIFKNLTPWIVDVSIRPSLGLRHIKDI
jgi:hypothetical protein